MDTATLEYLLQPELLTSQLPRMEEVEALQTLKTLLTVLQMEKAKVLPGTETEPGEEAVTWPNPGLAQSLAVSTRKQCLLQRMVLQISAHLTWRLGLLDRELPLALQQQLMDTVVTAASVQAVIGQLRLENVESSLSGLSERAGLFALTFFFRWTIRSLAVLRLPSPTGAKALIYASPFRRLKLPNMSTVVGENPSINDILFNIAKVALRSLQYLLGIQPPFEAMPSPASFHIGQGALVCTLHDWTPRPDVDWTSAILYDLALHYLNNEDYAQSAQKIGLLNQIAASRLSPDVDRDIYRGMKEAVGRRDFEAPAFGSDHQAEIAALIHYLKDGDRPLYWHSHAESTSAYYQHPQAATIVARNASLRLRHHCTPTYEALHSASLNLDEASDQCAIFTSLKNPERDSESLFSSEKPSLTCRLHETRSKRPKLRRRAAITALFRSVEPQRLGKLVNDVSKQQQPVRRVSSRWSVDAENPQEILPNLSRGGKEADLDFTLLCKIHQLLRLGQLIEARTLLKFLEDRNTKSLSVPALRSLQFQMLSAELSQRFSEKRLVSNEQGAKCRETLSTLRLFFTDIQTFHLDNCLIALINREDWEFILSLEEPRWLILQLTQILIRIATLVKAGAHLPQPSIPRDNDMKRNCKALVELLAPLLHSVSPSGSNKRSRQGELMGVASQPERQILVNYLVKIHQPDVLTVVASVLISLYNYALDDTSLKVHDSFPPLPFTTGGLANLLLSQDQFVSLFHELIERAHPHDLVHWYRLQGQLQFSLGNYSVALPNYLQSLIVQTNFFQRPLSTLALDQDDRIVQHMVKCLTELGCHSFAAAICQGLHDADYCLAFKGLEERQSNDAMDGVYAKVWDTTILEYAVSMHTKRGEQSRKKSALDKMAWLEVNTNNNMEIIREVALTRRSQLLRCLCLKFL